jgi:bifunctional DNase/RNase
MNPYFVGPPLQTKQTALQRTMMTHDQTHDSVTTDDVIEMQVDSIRVSFDGTRRVLVLIDLDGRRYLPMTLSDSVARKLAFALCGRACMRSLVSDLIANLWAWPDRQQDQLTVKRELAWQLPILIGARIRHVLVTTIVDGTFGAELLLQRGTHTYQVEAAPTKAITQAVCHHAPIYVRRAVLDQAGFQRDAANADQVQWSPRRKPFRKPRPALRLMRNRRRGRL